MRIMVNGQWGDTPDEIITPTNANYQEPNPIDEVPVRTKRIIKKELTKNLKVVERKKQK